jgi:hypothetical protein
MREEIQHEDRRHDPWSVVLLHILKFKVHLFTHPQRILLQKYMLYVEAAHENAQRHRQLSSL